MAGSLYLGSQKVCPAVVIGGGAKECARYVINNGTATERTTLTGNEFKDITSIGNYAFCYVFYMATRLSGNLDLSSVESIGVHGMDSAFYQCSSLTSVDLSSLKSVGGHGLERAFYECEGLTSADLSSLKSVSFGDGRFDMDGCRRFFYGCYNLTSVDLSSLENAGGQSFFQAFKGTSLETIRFPSLKNIKSTAFGGAFIDCTFLTDIYFNSLTTQSFPDGNRAFSLMFDGRDAGGWFGDEVVTVHFPSNLQSTIEGLDGYPTFGGDSDSVILEFDLPATS